MNRRAFTLIELLVVVTVIAILAAIAVPNFLEAQVRSKVSRNRADLRTYATALESYMVDNNAYPGANVHSTGGARSTFPGDPTILERLSTPVAYVTEGLLINPFESTKRSDTLITGLFPIHTAVNDWVDVEFTAADSRLYRSYLYTAVRSANTPSGLDRARVDLPEPFRQRAEGWVVFSPGPMRGYINIGGVIVQGTREYSVNLLYDPTNGTVSFGNVFRTGGVTAGDNLFGAVAAQ